MRFLRRSLVGLFLLSLTVGILAWAGNTFYEALQTRWAEESFSQPARERVFAVNVVTVERATITPILTAFGEVRSRRTLDLRSSAGGRIVELADGFEEGGAVQAGQLLVRIDPQDAQAAVDVARTDLTEAEAELRDARRGLELARDELAAAERQARLRDRALERQQNLSSRGVGTDAAVETAELAASSAGQAVLSSRQAIASAEARVDQAGTSLERVRIALAETERGLSDTQIFAGFAGTLAEVSAVEGGLVANNERLAQIVDAGALEVAFRVSTPQYARLLDETGGLTKAEIDVSLDIFGVDLATTGKITRESAAVGEGQTGRLLFARLDEAKGFRPGDFVTVRIMEAALEDVALLPATAVGSFASVLVVGAEDRLEEIAVPVLRRQEDDVIVPADRIAGRQIVAERSPLLGIGIKVRPIAPDGDQETAAAEPEMLELTDERRAKLVAFIEGNTGMPAEAKARVLGQLQQPMVPVQVVERIEARMGG
ncbi:MAG: HlyD family efflux transporter periplasmic adaptor subunit [Paracoccaceae bacterium]